MPSELFMLRLEDSWLIVLVRLFVRAAPKDSRAYVQIFESALAELRSAIGATELESFVVGLEDICWDGEKLDEGAESGDVEKLLGLWEVSIVDRFVHTSLTDLELSGYVKPY